MGYSFWGDLKNDDRALTELTQGEHPVVALCRGPSPASLFTVNTDNLAGTRGLLDHLYELGHRRIAFINGGWLGDMRERREAYQEYLMEKGLSQPTEWLQTEINSPSGGYQAMQRLLRLEQRPTAVFAADDMIAFGALKAIADAGLHVPSDISVVGFDDIELAEFYTPSLTTVRQPITEMSRQALNLMLDLIANPRSVLAEIVIRVRPELIVRMSTGCPKT